MSLLHVPKLREFWAEMLEDGPRLRPDEAQTLLSGLGLNILEVNRFVLAERPPFEAFERWIIATNGGSLDEAELDRLRRALRGEMVGSACGDLSGVEGLSGEGDADIAGRFQAMLLRAPGTRVEGGTDEIMRNIIAERVLGLPGDIRVDKDVPFNKVPTKGRN